jgi:hypothetical protein
MEKEWVRVFEASDELKIEIAQQILADKEIESVIINKKDSIYRIGEIEVYVHRDNVIRAKQALKEL